MKSNTTSLFLGAFVSLVLSTQSYGLTLASDSEQIKNSEATKVSFKDISTLVDLSKDKNKVLHKGKIISAAAGLRIVTNGNEEHFCGVSGAEKLHKNDYLQLVDGSIEQVDAKNDIYKSTIIFRNKNGDLSFSCVHATPHFYLEDLRLNFAKSIVLIGIDGKTENEAQYMNPQTENRLLRTIQIIRTDVFQKITMQENAKESFSMMNGKIVGTEYGLNHVSAGAASMSCMVVRTSGVINSQKIFVQVGQGISQDTDKHIPVAGVYYIYRADRESAFILNCVQLKKARVGEFFSMAKGLFKFGKLNRKEYNQKRSELKKIQAELEK